MTPRVQVFAVEHDTVQLTWSSLPACGMTFEVGGREAVAGEPPPFWYRLRGRRRPSPGRAGPGALTVGGLDPSSDYDVLLSGPGHPRRAVAAVRTMRAPEGRILSRFATISDCHIGERRFAPLKVLHDPVPMPAGLEPYPVRCASAAIREAEEWGAALVVAKGDLTQDGKPGEVAAAVGVLRRARVPVAVALGNHDVRTPYEAAAALAEGGFPASAGARALDVDGVTLILGHSPVPDRHAGRLPADHVREITSLAERSGGPVVLVLHHPLRRWPVETHYPPSVSWRDSRRLAAGLTGLGTGAVVVSGHTHRNRLYRVGGLPVAEVGSTKDYPGQWAGYSVYEGEIRQVVRRVAHPDSIAWNEMTARALGGVWGRWSPGSLGDRCWALRWPGRLDRAEEGAGSPQG